MSILSRRNLLRGQWRRSSAIRPPWSIEEQRFVDGCSRCHACVEACETGVIIVSNARAFPEIDFQRAECTFCGRCAEVCPEPLFRPLETQPWQRIAVINQTCLTYQGVTCRSCQDVCEPNAIKFRLRLGGTAQPELDQQSCTGCGSCVRSCPVQAITTRESDKDNDGKE
ncbi:ferredoxin-type protein [Pragia fontium]|uniref:Ferredoxin-type protein NapF n=1 Tax=Pragia fontium TaxID=82985 RepID=A0ABQ5LMP9_9GAMM|nr:ferredoxin-type protein NapF [Pragia fontium]GKX63893.1 ferredoxin-type protein NapF [Pragia fontium]SUB83310.1 ferredoxin-type protein [Pragia fontium]